MTEAPAIAVLMACHNRRATTLACLKSVAAQAIEATLHAIVYDDGSTDGTAAAICALYPTAVVLPGSGAAFWAGGMRAAFDHALALGFDHYLWLNDDVVLDPDAVSRLLEAAHGTTKAGLGPVLVAGAVADPGTGAFAYGGIDRRPGMGLRFRTAPPLPGTPRFCDTTHGNVVLIPAATAATVGSLGPAFVHSLGDLDYGLRVRKAGGRVVLVPGYVGRCEANPRAQRWFDPSTPLVERWRLLADPRGFPIRPWLHFARSHGGRLWWIAAVRPFWRLLVPAALARRLHSERSADARPA